MSGLQITAEQREQLERITKSSQRHAGWWRSGTIADILLANAAPAASEPEHGPECACGYCMSCQERGVPFPEDGTATPEPLRVEVGKWYERRDGRITGPLKHTPPGTMFAKTHPFQVGCSTYRECGRYAPLDDDQDCLSDLIREVPASVPVGECGHSETNWTAVEGQKVCLACGELLDVRDLGEQTTTHSPPKFKVGDRVTTTAVDDAGVGTVIEIVNERNIRVKFDNKIYDECVELVYDLHLVTPSPRTIELFDGCCLRDDSRAYWLLILGENFYIRDERDRISQISKNDIYAGIYTRDPSRDQHPVGSEWVDIDHPGDKWILWKNTKGLFALGDSYLEGADGDGITLHAWAKNVKEATRGARRADVVSVEVA